MIQMVRYPGEQVTYYSKKRELVNSFPLEKYAKEGIPEMTPRVAEIAGKYGPYLKDVMLFAKEHNDYTDIYTDDAILNLKSHILYDKDIAQEIMSTLMITPNVSPQVRKTLIAEPKIWNVLINLFRNNYDKQKAHYLKYVNQLIYKKEDMVTEEEQEYMINALESATMPYNYDTMMLIEEKDQRLCEIVRKTADDMNYSDFNFWKLWNQRFYKESLNEEEITEVLRATALCMNDDEFTKLGKILNIHKRDLKDFNGEKIGAYIQELREYRAKHMN